MFEIWLIGRLRVALIAALISASGEGIAQECIPLKQGISEPGGFRYGPTWPAPGATVIDKPGRYCLHEDLRVAGHYWPFTPEGPKLFSDDVFIVLLSADDVTLDFKGHAAVSDAQLRAGLMTPRDKPSTFVPKDLPSIVPKNLTIRNGTIRVSRHGMAVEIFGVGPQEILTNIVKDATSDEFPQFKDDPKFLHEWLVNRNRERAELRSTFMPNAAAYPVRNLHIESMRIRSKSYAVVFQGAGSVIRDSVIETDSGTALWLYGPNALVENNTIIVHCQAQPMSYEGASYCDEMDAPIRLMHGDGSVIRNNHFILKGNAQQRAVSLFDTGAFIFEGNTITGLDNIDHAVQVFRGTLQATNSKPNRVDNSLAARIKVWFE